MLCGGTEPQHRAPGAAGGEVAEADGEQPSGWALAAALGSQAQTRVPRNLKEVCSIGSRGQQHAGDTRVPG